jgi:hypothetical protein
VTRSVMKYVGSIYCRDTDFSPRHDFETDCLDFHPVGTGGPFPRGNADGE